MERVLFSQVFEDRVNAELLRIWESLGEEYTPTPNLLLPNKAPEWTEDQLTYHLAKWAMEVPYRVEDVPELDVVASMTSEGVSIRFIRREETFFLDIEFPERVSGLDEHRVKAWWDAVGT